MESLSSIRRPSQGELLSTLDFLFHEHQRDSSKALRLVKDQPDRLHARPGGTPTIPAFLRQRRFNREGIVLGRDLNRRCPVQVQPRSVRGEVGSQGYNPFAHLQHTLSYLRPTRLWAISTR